MSELCWIKAVRLSPLEIGVRVASLVLAVAWVLVMKSAKGTYYNIEFLLGLLPLVLAWSTSGSLRIGCSGDFEESYEERRGARGALFRGWIDTLRAKEPDWMHLQGPTYDILLNPHRIAWIRPCYQWQLFPLIVIACFTGYLSLLKLSLPKDMPVIEDFQILIFESGSGSVRTLSFLIIAVATVAFVLSLKRSMEICGTGGVQDTFPMSAEDQGRLVDMVVGKTAPRSTASVVKTAKGGVQTMEVAVTPAAKPVVVAPAPVAPAEPAKEEEPKP